MTLLTTLRFRIVSLAMLMTLAAAFIAVPLSAGAAPRTSGGTATLSDLDGNVLGTVTNLHAAANDGPHGPVTITGTFTDSQGNSTPFSTTLVREDPTCPILDLTLGPLDLNLLGLMVHLDQVHLTITANSGPGNLLGNLLCSVANLLNSNSSSMALSNLLNNLFSLL